MSSQQHDSSLYGDEPIEHEQQLRHSPSPVANRKQQLPPLHLNAASSGTGSGGTVVLDSTKKQQLRRAAKNATAIPPIDIPANQQHQSPVYMLNPIIPPGLGIGRNAGDKRNRANDFSSANATAMLPHFVATGNIGAAYAATNDPTADVEFDVVEESAVDDDVQMMEPQQNPQDNNNNVAAIVGDINEINRVFDDNLVSQVQTIYNVSLEELQAPNRLESQFGAGQSQWVLLNQIQERTEILLNSMQYGLIFAGFRTKLSPMKTASFSLNSTLHRSLDHGYTFVLCQHFNREDLRKKVNIYPNLLQSNLKFEKYICCRYQKLRL